MSLFAALAALLIHGLGIVSVSAAQAPDRTIVVVGYVEHQALGTILTDTAGITLYTWAGDTQSAGTSSCYEACAGAWPPMLVDGDIGAALMSNSMPSAFGAILRSDMTYQLAYEGWPLYSFVRDAAPGDVNGDGSTGFGGRWSVVPLSITDQGV
jgi:predicted lipoprotein with Yx(FWY)xxD motif